MTHTNLIRWEPFLRDPIAGRFNQLFDSFAAPVRYDVSAWSPAVDIFDTGTALVFEAELPGFRQNDIDVRVEDNVLMLQGERKRELNGNGSYLRTERSAGVFSRSFALPTSVDHTKAEATYRDGILRLVMPKTEAAMPRHIDIKVH